jgi:lipoic acid synthetase
MIMGAVCTRSCRFCGVESGIPAALDPNEPQHVAEAAAALGLGHVVVTSVTRDDLVDGGAGHFVATVKSIREQVPGATLELLIPDFSGSAGSLEAVLAAQPEVLNHNVETVPRLYDAVRPQAEYERSLEVLRRAADDGGCAVKAGFMVGLGESATEVEALLTELRGVGVDIVTIGQYLQPSRVNTPVCEYVEPDVFEHYKDAGEAMGLLVEAGPLVRSSFHAAEGFAKLRGRRGKSSSVELQ